MFWTVILVLQKIEGSMIILKISVFAPALLSQFKDLIRWHRLVSDCLLWTHVKRWSVKFAYPLLLNCIFLFCIALGYQGMRTRYKQRLWGEQAEDATR